MSESNYKLAIIMTSNGWGGLEMNTMKLTEALANHSIEVHQIVAEGTRYCDLAKAKFENVFVLQKPRKYFDFRSAKIVRNQLKDKNIQNVFVPFRADLDLVALVKRKTARTFTIIHQQHMAMDITKTGITQRYRYRAIDVWLCPLEILIFDVLKNTEVPRSKIRIAPIGIETGKYLNFECLKEAAQENLNCKTKAKLLGVIGRIDVKKGQLFLVKALKELRNFGENVELIIIGEPTLNDASSNTYFKEIKDFVAENGLQNFVYFSDFTDDVRVCFKAIDALIMSSQKETYGMVTLEAMLSMTPVIGTNSGGTSEILDFGKRGELYEVDDLTSFIESYRKLFFRLETKDLNLQSVQSEIAQQFDLSIEVNAVINAMS